MTAPKKRHRKNTVPGVRVPVVGKQDPGREAEYLPVEEQPKQYPYHEDPFDEYGTLESYRFDYKAPEPPK